MSGKTLKELLDSEYGVIGTAERDKFDKYCLVVQKAQELGKELQVQPLDTKVSIEVGNYLTMYLSDNEVTEMMHRKTQGERDRCLKILQKSLWAGKELGVESYYEDVVERITKK